MDLAGTRGIFTHSGTVPGNPGQLLTLLLPASRVSHFEDKTIGDLQQIYLIGGHAALPDGSASPDSYRSSDNRQCFHALKAREACVLLLCYTACAAYQ